MKLEVYNGICEANKVACYREALQPHGLTADFHRVEAGHGVVAAKGTALVRISTLKLCTPSHIILTGVIGMDGRSTCPSVLR